MTENCSRSSEERDQEAEVEQILLKELGRKMNPLVAKVIEEMELEEVGDSKEEIFLKVCHQLLQLWNRGT